MKYEKPEIGNKIIFYKTFPYLIEIICTNCNHKEIYSLKFYSESYRDKNIQKVLKTKSLK